MHFDQATVNEVNSNNLCTDRVQSTVSEVRWYHGIIRPEHIYMLGTFLLYEKLLRNVPVK